MIIDSDMVIDSDIGTIVNLEYGVRKSHEYESSIWFVTGEFVHLKNYHLFGFININRTNEIFQNEKINFTFLRAGLFPWNRS